MKKSLRAGDTLSRIGGDEFIVVMVDIEEIEDCQSALKRLLEAATEIGIMDDTVMQISVSIDITLYSQGGEDADQLIRHADHAMYIAKREGKNRFHWFDAVQENAINSQHKNISDIVSALERREFVLHYQPKVNMRTGQR